MKEKLLSMFKSKVFIITVIGFIATALYDFDLFNQAVHNTYSQLGQALMIIPVIFILIGLIDVWVDRQAMIKYMGEGSGLVGILVAFTFGTLAAGPLVGAFPLAFVMLKKGARYANVLFFLTIWSSAKIPIILFQVQSMGLKFTVVSNLVLITVFLAGSFVVEKLLGKTEIGNIVRKAEAFEI